MPEFVEPVLHAGTWLAALVVIFRIVLIDWPASRSQRGETLENRLSKIRDEADTRERNLRTEMVDVRKQLVECQRCCAAAEAKAEHWYQVASAGGRSL